MITIEDVKEVASELNFKLDNADLTKVLENYNVSDSDDNWSFIIEDILYNEFSDKQVR